MGIVLTFQILGVVFTAAVPLIFAAPRLPRVKGIVRPLAFEEGWYSLVLQSHLNHRENGEAGFQEVLEFIIEHRHGNELLADAVASDLGIDASEIIPETGVPAVEEIRISSKPPNWREEILLCYDEETEGPPGEPKEPQSGRYQLQNTERSGEDWRYIGPLSGYEHNALRYTNEKIDNWTTYGAIILSIGVLFSILSIILESFGF